VAAEPVGEWLMSVKVKCPKCRWKATLPDHYADQQMRCPECLTKFQSPATTKSALLAMLKVSMWVFVLVGILAAIRYFLVGNLHNFFYEW
jgi:hypothetical protein